MFINSEAYPCEHCGKLSNLTLTNPAIKDILDEINLHCTLPEDEEDRERFCASNLSEKTYEKLANKYMKPFMVRMDEETYKEVFIAARFGTNLIVETTKRDSESVFRNYYIATSDLYFIPQHGSDSIQLVIPKGIKVFNVAGTGHSGYYDMDTNTSHDFKFYLFDWMLAPGRSKLFSKVFG